MPPKPRPIFRQTSSSAVKDVSNTPATSMPPPPDPPQPHGILVPETTALSACLTNAVVKTGQIYGFYADTHRLGIGRHAPYPPRSLTASLGREVEKYDQLCDAIQSHLRRAIAVLQRDLDRERQRIKAATAPPEPDQTPVQSSFSVEPSSTAQAESTGQKPLPPRRQSTISLSSLHRAPFPHKLDLSSISLRFNADELPIQTGLASPVSLAPKSSISRSSLPPDLQGVDIDLTVPTDANIAAGMQAALPLTAQSSGSIGLDPTLGNSADKPIELDMDIDIDMFTNASHPGTEATSSVPFKSAEIDPPKLKQEDTVIDLDLFHAFSKDPSGGDNAGSHILSALGTQGQGAQTVQLHASGSQDHSQVTVMTANDPGLLAGLSGVTEQSGSDQNYGLDLHLFGPSGMEDLFNMDHAGTEGGT